MIEHTGTNPPCIEILPADGLYCGTTFEVRCVNPALCRPAEQCYWRKFHEIPAGQMAGPDVPRGTEPTEPSGQLELL